MDGTEGIMLSEISETKRQIMYEFTHMWNIKLNKTETHSYR